MKAIEKLQKELSTLGFDFNKTDLKGYWGAKYIDLPEKRIRGDRHKFGNVYIYISGRMYGNSERSFRYAMCYQKDRFVPFKCRDYNYSELEHGKIYVSGKTINEVLDKLIPYIKEAFEQNRYHLN